MIWGYLPGKEIEPATAFLLPDSWLYCRDRIGKKKQVNIIHLKSAFKSIFVHLLPDDIMLQRVKQFKL